MSPQCTPFALQEELQHGDIAAMLPRLHNLMTQTLHTFAVSRPSIIISSSQAVITALWKYFHTKVVSPQLVLAMAVLVFACYNSRACMAVVAYFLLYQCGVMVICDDLMQAIIQLCSRLYRATIMSRGSPGIEQKRDALPFW